MSRAYRILIDLIRSLLTTLLFAGPCLAFGAEPARAPQAKSDPAWDAVFTRTEGWTGGDVVGTVDLKDGRVLWLFGDTWVGQVADGGHKSGSHMVNNSVAVSVNDEKRSMQPPEASQIEFLWGANDSAGKPTAWVVPPSPPKDEKSARRTWYWTTGGGAVVPGPQGKPRLLVFLFDIGQSEGNSGVWGFEGRGGAMAVVDQADRPAHDWQPRAVTIPFCIGASQVRDNNRLRETSWGVAAVLTAGEKSKVPDLLYIYGIRNESPLNRQLLVARAAVNAVDDFHAWRFFAGDGIWSPQAASAKPIAENLANELSVEQTAGKDGKPEFVLVHSEAALGRKIFVRLAQQPEGPWSAPTMVYSADDVERNPAYFAYAAKGHLLLSPPGELLISYVINANDFNAMVHDASIYRPRFVRVPLDLTGEHAGVKPQAR